jgi:hypothetical protein
MGQITLQTTTLGKATVIQQQAERALPFLISYKDMVLVPEIDVQNLAKMRTFSNTVLNELAVLAGNEGKYSSINFLNFNGFNSSIPEILTVNDILIDGRTIQSAPAFLQKAWVNLTPILGKKRVESDPIYVTDIPRLQQLVVRALLSMSYNDSDKWLEPRLSVFIIESYSMTIAGQLQIAFNLNFDEVRLVQTIFALFYAQRLSGSDEDLTRNWPILINRCGFLGSQVELVEKLDMLSDFCGEDKLLSIDKCISILSKNGPSRMARFDSRGLYQMFSRSNAEAQSMLYALDYPPYWVYLVLKTLSNDKNPILATTFKVTDLKKKAMLFGSELKSSKFFIPMVDRNVK